MITKDLQKQIDDLRQLIAKLELGTVDIPEEPKVDPKAEQDAATEALKKQYREYYAKLDEKEALVEKYSKISAELRAVEDEIDDIEDELIERNNNFSSSLAAYKKKYDNYNLQFDTEDGKHKYQLNKTTR